MSESDKGEGRGLPVGWGWRPRTGAFNDGEVDLYPPGAEEGAERATVYPSGKWETWEDGHSAVRVTEGTAADSAAAQAAAEAALWATDGYGTGEVRGRFVAHGQGFGLPGRWRTKAIRRVDGGHEVDAVREGVEVGAAHAPSGQAVVAEWCCSLCKWHGATPERIALGRRCPSCHGEASLWIDYSFADEDAVRAPSAVEPAAAIDESTPLQREFTALRDAGFAPPAPAEPAPVDGETLGEWRSRAGQPGDDTSAASSIAWWNGRWAPIAACVPGPVVSGEGEPAPREPSAPTDGAELARLLPGLLDYCAAVLAEPDEDTRSRLGVGKHLALACSLLLAERERVSAILQALFSDVATPIELATHTTELLEEAARETDKLRARVAELEEQAKAPPPAVAGPLAAARPIVASFALAMEERMRANDHKGGWKEDAAAALFYRLREESMELQFALGEQGIPTSIRREAADVANFAMMIADNFGGLEAAHPTAHLGGAPSTLARVAAEVCALVDGALPDDTAPEDVVALIISEAEDDWPALDEDCRPRLATLAAMALAGMLACDAPATKEPT